jgi:hypothetical protein
MLYSQVLLNGWITCTHYGWDPQLFQRTSGHLKNLHVRRVTKEVNLKFRHCLGVAAHTIWKYLEYVCHLAQSCNWLSLMETLEMYSAHAFWRLYTLKSKNVIMESIKHNILSVSNAVAWCQEYVYITACLARKYTYTDSLEASQDGFHTLTWEGQLRGRTIKFANSPPCACRGSTGKKPWYGLMTTSAFHSYVVVDLWQSLCEWHRLLSACVSVCHCENVGAWIRAANEH